MDETDHSLYAWLCLLHTPGLGSRGIARLRQQGIGAAELIRQPELGNSSRLTTALRKPDLAAIERDLDWVQAPNRHILHLDDPRYPRLLADIADPPPVLFVVGDPELLAQPQLAMVGSRNPSPSGSRTACDFARHLAQSGLLITSGMATGIDAAGHQGALDAGAPTLAVMGTGPDRVYPARHRELAHRIAETGALVTEFPPGSDSRAAHFPRRNRIISGLALGTLVVEAALKSGSLITARLAAEQGREVFAIPGSIHNPLARGCHALIRQGAKLVEQAADILQELAPQLLPLLAEEHASEAADLPPEGQPDDPDYRLLLQQLDHDPQPLDQIIERSGLTAEAVSSMLLLLELDGKVTAFPGSRYCLTGRS